ncbi:MAG: hypothetical protein RR468_15665 [Clostridium sp.]
MWLSDLSAERIKLKSLIPFKKKPSKTKSPGKNKKLPNKRPGITKILPGSKQWKEIYKIRTCSEGINNRILNNYKLHTLRIYGKKRYSFMTMIASINIHLDAQFKAFKFNILSLLS